jgi:hypothetical protein
VIKDDALKFWEEIHPAPAMLRRENGLAAGDEPDYEVLVDLDGRNARELHSIQTAVLNRGRDSRIEVIGENVFLAVFDLEPAPIPAVVPK